TRAVGEEFDGKGLLLLPGAVDTAPDLGGSGLCEDIELGTRAAAAGGITSVLIAPGGDRALTDALSLDRALARAEEEAVVHHGFFVCPGRDDPGALRDADRAVGILVGPEAAPRFSDPHELEALLLAADKPIALAA